MSRSSSSTRLSILEKLVLVHVGVLLLGSSWVFGGNIGWARLALSAWASFALPLTCWSFLSTSQSASDARRAAWWLIPPALYALLVVTSSFNPSFRSVTSEGGTLLIHSGPAHPGWPSTVNPSDSLASFWFGAGAYLSAFNITLILRSRSGLRFLFVLVSVNALALSVFGTLQALAKTSLYFGTVESPNTRFFATFIYNNHWGAFMILALCVALGLVFYHTRHFHGRDLWHSPFSAALLGVLLIAATAPLSASRAATAMAALVLIVAVVCALVRIVRVRRRNHRSIWPPVILLASLIITSSAPIGWIGYQSINTRITETRAALEQNQNLLAGRAELYRDTWKLAARKPVFGWGLSSYGTAFQLIRPRPLQPERQYERSYDTAHNDWLQSLAETGFAGTALLLLTLALPLASLPLRHAAHPLVAWPLLGLGVVLLYAAIEFPFSNAAFLILFWTSLFTAIRYARLQPDAPA